MEEEHNLIDHMEKQVDHLPFIRSETQQRIKFEQQKQKERHDAKKKESFISNWRSGIILSSFIR